MYKASIRALMRHSVDKLNGGDYSLMLKMVSPDFELAFPGENTWATMFRPQELGRQRHVTHRGVEEATAFADRFVGEGIQFEIEDILVNGPPWNTRIALRVHDFISGKTKGRTCTTTGPCSSLSSDGGDWSDGRTTRTPSASRHGTADRAPAQRVLQGGSPRVRLTTPETPGCAIRSETCHTVVSSLRRGA